MRATSGSLMDASRGRSLHSRIATATSLRSDAGWIPPNRRRCRTPVTAGSLPKTSLLQLLGQARTAIIANSTLPLTIFYVLAATSLLVMAVLSAFTLYHKLITGLAVPGWTSHIITASFFGAMNSLGIAILGEYVLRIYNQVRRRPIYVIAPTQNRSRQPSQQLARQRPGYRSLGRSFRPPQR